MTKTQLSDKWIKASVAGTIWAASEIVFGSFLHNLRIPFCGNILTAIGLIILISIAYLWKDKGIFWRAGLICALMKTISPSAVIFGPMIAIFSEAVLLELSVLIFGRTYFGFILGSILAMSWNLVQKILSYILFYGFDILEIYAGLVKIAEKQINYHFDLLWTPVFILLAAYVVFGVIAGITGIRVGKKILTKSGEEEHFVYKTEVVKPKAFEIKHSLGWFFFNIAAMIGGLILLKFSAWYIWTSFIALLAVAWVLRYRRALKKISNPKFWILFVLITLVTVFVFSKFKSGEDYLMNGILTGVEMNLRAVLMILGFSVLAVELYNPKIRDFLRKSTFRQLPIALELSFESLPVFVSAIPDFKTALRNPVRVFYSVILNADNRMQQIKSQVKAVPGIYLVSGRIADGKTSFVKQVAAGLKEKQISVGGIFSEKVFENDILLGYDIVDVINGERKAFLRAESCSDCKKIGKYAIFEEGFEFGRKTILKALTENKFVIIDEAGKLELDGTGWSEILGQLNNFPETTFLITVRDINVKEMVEKFGFVNPILMDVKKCNVEMFL